jgi:hypothetical protein
VEHGRCHWRADERLASPGQRTGTLASALAALTLVLCSASAGAQGVVIDGGMHHLGTAGAPEWDEFASDPPEGRGLALRFQGSARSAGSTLLIRQRDVKLDWPVRLNGRTIGRLFLMEVDLVQSLAVPADTMKDGENLLEIGPPSGVDDVVVGEVVLDSRPPGQAIGGATLDVRVIDDATGRGLPSRITVVDPRGVLVALTAEAEPEPAVRPGVVYTALGRARVGVRPGRYTVHATRGFEYSLASQEVTVGAGQRRPVVLTLRREVPTPGLVACDTHIHTLTRSGHGDATVDERLVTLAGEGIELPIATEHNLLADNTAPAQRLGLLSALTPVVGDEVTTRRGHFCAFPFDPTGSVPDARLTYWPDLMKAIRAGSSGRVIILNHPRDDHDGFRPFGPSHFNAAVGEDRDGGAPGFDAVEVINSGALQSDPMLVVRDWFALWNHGHEVTAVGASDSHDVSRFIVGQGRTYIACGDADPARIDVTEACRSLRAGRALVSLGLLARLTVNDRFGPGDLATGVGERLRVAVTVLGPSWVRADRVELFANGVKVREQDIAGLSGVVEKARVVWTLPRPPHDVALVAVASGPGVTAPFWAIPRPYQPSTRTWVPRVLGITNPVRVDADGSGVWNSPRYYAQFAIEISGTEPGRLFRFLGAYDEAVATQAAAFCLPAGQDHWPPEVAKALESAPAAVRKGFAACLAGAHSP